MNFSLLFFVACDNLIILHEWNPKCRFEMKGNVNGVDQAMLCETWKIIARVQIIFFSLLNVVVYTAFLSINIYALHKYILTYKVNMKKKIQTF